MRKTHFWKRVFYEHVVPLKTLYLFVGILFLMGVIFGAFIVNLLGEKPKADLLHYLKFFFQGLLEDNIADHSVAFQHSLGEYLKTIGLLWLLGLTVVGIPFILLYLFFKGLAIGFTVGFLVQQLSWQGFWFAFVSLAPVHFFVLPAILIISVSAIHFSLTIVRNRLIDHRGTIYPQFFSFSLLVVSFAGLLCLAALFEAYISPWLMKEAVPHFSFLD